MNRRTVSIVALVLTASLLPSVLAGATFFLRLDEFENYEGLLSSHFKCDSGRPCDPKFNIDVRGGWGVDTKLSDCIVDKNHILFGNTIGTVLPNPLTYTMEITSFPVHIDIRVKDCLFEEAGDDIADFYVSLSDLPAPFLNSEIIDSHSDSDRIRKLELHSMPPAPMSIKLRVSVWQRCDLNYYGRLCGTFCMARIPGYVCDLSGILRCVSPGLCGGEVATSTTTKPTSTSTQSSTSIVVSTSTTSKTSSLALSTVKSSTKSPINSTPSVSMATTSSALSTIAAVVSVPKIKNPKRQPNSTIDAAQTNDGGPGSILSSPLHLLLMLILGLVLSAGITIWAVLCSRRRKEPRPITVSSVRFNRDGIGMDAPIGSLPHQQQQLQQCWTNQAYILEQQSLQYRQSFQPLALQESETQQQQQQDLVTRPDSGVYEEPIDISERNLPPLPPRSDLCAGTFNK